MKKILILNGPNLNMLGVREPEIYGHETLRDVEVRCSEKAKALGFKIDFRQSNHEGELVGWIQEARGLYDGIVINAAAYTHTSLAIYDALKMLNVPIIEVHISDPKQREEFRRFSYIGLVASAVVAGKGVQGYPQALEKMAELLSV